MTTSKVWFKTAGSQAGGSLALSDLHIQYLDSVEKFDPDKLILQYGAVITLYFFH